MQNVLAFRPASSTHQSVPRHPAGAIVCPRQCELDCRADHHFLSMLDSYRDSGGLARTTEVVARFKCRYGPNVATLTHWIVDREVICFAWQSQTWIPWFQFDRFDMTPREELRPVFAELASVYDPWEMGNWFARPNPWLADRPPVEALVSDLPAVLHAARADRFIANG